MLIIAFLCNFTIFLDIRRIPHVAVKAEGNVGKGI